MPSVTNPRPGIRSLASCAALALCLAAPAAAGWDSITTYRGPCDASAAAALDGDTFVVANDEDNTLRIYRRNDASALDELNASRFLGTGRRDEADIEAAAVIGTRIYWVTSHGRNSAGKARPSRHRLFATEIRAGSPPALELVGVAYRDLLRDLRMADALKPYAIGEAARRAPEAAGGLNIEGLAATPDGRLLIGLRNPLSGSRALIVPLDNPAQVVAGKRARLGTPLTLDLGGRGIRDMTRIGASYYIVAGPVADAGAFALYRWSGSATEAPVAIDVDLRDLRPEALFPVPGTSQIMLLSDDGGVLVGGRECKTLPPAEQTFRALTLTP